QQSRGGAMRGRAKFLAAETLAGIAAVYLIVVQALSYVAGFLERNDPSRINIGLITLAALPVAALILWTYRKSWRKNQTHLNQEAVALAAGSGRFALYLRPFITSGALKVPNHWPHFGQRALLGDPWDLELALATILDDTTPLVALGDTPRGFGAAKFTTS